MTALDIDSRKVDAVWRVDKQVPQAVDKVGIERIRQVARQMPKQAIRAGGGKRRRILKKRLRQCLLRREGTCIADGTDFVRDDGVTKAIGGALKLFADPRVHRRVIAVIWGNRVLAQQMRQEL